MQRAPSHLPSSKDKYSPGAGWLSDSGINCPDGTVPIRRTTREDLIRQRSSPVQPQDNDPFTSNDPNTYVRKRRNYFLFYCIKMNFIYFFTDVAVSFSIQYAVQRLKTLDRPYTSTKALFSAHMPKVNTGEFSGALTWLYGGDGKNVNYISAGWMVGKNTLI